MSFTPARPHSFSRRSILAATAGLASGWGAGKSAFAQIGPGDLPEAGPALPPMMPSPAPAISFTDTAGKHLTLASFAGQGLVVNFWATWCAPCVAEIPSLAAIAPVLAKHGIQVLPISIDIEGAKAVQPFYASHNITGLPILLDPAANSLDALAAAGIPVTIIINATGQLAGRLDGAANWNTPGTIKTIRQLAGPKPGAINSGTPVSFKQAVLF